MSSTSTATRNTGVDHSSSRIAPDRIKSTSTDPAAEQTQATMYARKAGSHSLIYHQVAGPADAPHAACRRSIPLDGDGQRTAEQVDRSTYGMFCLACPQRRRPAPPAPVVAAPAFEVRAEDAGRVLDIGQAFLEADSEEVRRFFASRTETPLQAAVREAAAGLAARPNLVDDLTGARVVGTRAIGLSTSSIHDVHAVVKLTSEQLDALARCVPPADGPVVAVLVLPWRRAIVVGVFDSPDAAELWWCQRYNKGKDLVSLVLRPVAEPTPTEEAVAEGEATADVRATTTDPSQDRPANSVRVTKAEPSITSQARTILATATATTHRPLLAWAVGVLGCSSAVDLLTYWRTQDPRSMAPDYFGLPLPAGRRLRLTKAHIEITDGNLRQPLRLDWTDVAHIITAGRVTNDLRRRCEDAATARRDYPDFRAPGWADVVNACSRAGDAVWAACRPADPGQQLDLFADW